MGRGKGRFEHKNGEHENPDARHRQKIPASITPVPQVHACCSEAASSDGQVELSPAEVRSLADFFLLLEGWDRIVTKVAEQPAAPETTAA